jgi:hypothetical protein
MLDSAGKIAKRFLHNVRSAAYLDDANALVEIIQQAREEGARWAIKQAHIAAEIAEGIGVADDLVAATGNPANVRRVAP